AKRKQSRLNCGVNPGAARTKLAATLGGTPVIIPMYPSQISPTKKAKVMTPNQSSAAAAPRRSVSTPCEASSASGASSASRLTSCAGPMYAAPSRAASEANAGTKSRGSSKRRRSAEQGAGRDRPHRCPRQHGERAAQRGEAGELRQRLVRVHDEADRADENQKRGCGGGAARLRGSPVARRPVEQPARREQERAAREPRRGVELDEVLEELPEGERHPVIQRRIVQ